MKKRWSIRDFVFKNKIFENSESRKQVKIIQAYQNCFQDEFGNLTRDGEIVLKDLLQRGYLENSVAMLTDNRTIDVNATFIAEGKRTLVLEILELLKFDLHNAIQLQEINNE